MKRTAGPYSRSAPFAYRFARSASESRDGGALLTCADCTIVISTPFAAPSVLAVKTPPVSIRELHAAGTGTVTDRLEQKSIGMAPLPRLAFTLLWTKPAIARVVT